MTIEHRIFGYLVSYSPCNCHHSVFLTGLNHAYLYHWDKHPIYDWKTKQTTRWACNSCRNCGNHQSPRFLASRDHLSPIYKPSIIGEGPRSGGRFNSHVFHRPWRNSPDLSPQDGAPKIARLTYKWLKYGLWYI